MLVSEFKIFRSFFHAKGKFWKFSNNRSLKNWIKYKSWFKNGGTIINFLLPFQLLKDKWWWTKNSSLWLQNIFLQKWKLKITPGFLLSNFRYCLVRKWSFLQTKVTLHLKLVRIFNFLLYILPDCTISSEPFCTLSSKSKWIIAKFSSRLRSH